MVMRALYYAFLSCLQLNQVLERDFVDWKRGEEDIW
jgi:hypothetical protein